MQSLADGLRGALGEQRVDPLRRLERRLQAAAGLDIQHERRGTKMQVRIQQHGVAPQRHAEVPGEIRRDRRGADTAANAGDRHRLPPELALRGGALTAHEQAEMADDLVARERLRQVVGRAQAAGDLAIEVDVVDLADDQHADIGLDDVREIAEGGQRLILAAYVHHQYLGRRLLLHRGDRVAYVAAPDVELAGHEVGQSVFQRLLGMRIGGKGNQRRPIVPRRGRTTRVCSRAEKLGYRRQAWHSASASCAAPPPAVKLPGFSSGFGRSCRARVTAPSATAPSALATPWPRIMSWGSATIAATLAFDAPVGYQTSLPMIRIEIRATGEGQDGAGQQHALAISLLIAR